MDVKFNFNVKRKFKVNGTEYDSLEEMPAAVREAYEKAVSKSGGVKFGETSSTKIVFNGQEYTSAESMPADLRQMYETIMNKVKDGEGVSTEKSGFQIGLNVPGIKDQGLRTHGGVNPKPIEPQSFFSPRVFVVAAAVIAVLIGLYFLLHIGSK